MSSYSTLVNIPQGGATLNWGDVAQTGCVRAGKYTCVADDDTNNKSTVDTGLTTVSFFYATVLRAGVDVATGQAAITEASGTITVTDAGTYATTADDVVHWIAVGV